METAIEPPSLICDIKEEKDPDKQEEISIEEKSRKEIHHFP